jgi:hypothetical protein
MMDGPLFSNPLSNIDAYMLILLRTIRDDLSAELLFSRQESSPAGLNCADLAWSSVHRLCRSGVSSQVNTPWLTSRMLCLEAAKEITVDAADGPHLADLGAQPDNLDTHVCPLLDDDVGVVGELRGGGAGIVLYLIRHQM